MSDEWRAWRDPLFWLAVVAYCFSRGLAAVGVAVGFFRNYFNDLLLIPVALPLVLEAHHGLRWRRRGPAPSWQEVVLHAAVWSVVCEGVGPAWLHRGTADPWDVVCYAAGAAPAVLWWRRWPGAASTRSFSGKSP